MLVLPLLLASVSHRANLKQVAETVLTPRIAEVAVFKPGLVYVVREAVVPSGLHQYRLNRVPQALDGTLWYSSPDGAKLSEIRTTIDLKGAASKRNLVTIPQLLSASVGLPVVISVRASGQKSTQPQTFKGILLNLDPQGILTLRLPNGRLRQLSTSEVLEVDSKGLPKQVDQKAPKVDFRFRVDAARPSRIRIVSLETGAAWVANYRLDMHGEIGHLESAAQLGLGPIDLQQSHVRLVSGLPALGGESRLDMAAGTSSLTAFLAHQPGTISTAASDPFELAEKMIRSASDSGLTNRYPDGLFRGGRPDIDGSMNMIRPYNLRNDPISYDAESSLTVKEGEDVPQFLRQAIAAARVEDLHTYEFGTVTLPAGGRITKVLASTEVPLSTIYRWNVDPAANFERILRLRNNTGAGWPAGLVFLQTDGIPVAQVKMPFTASGQDANLSLGAAEDLLHSVEVQELDREPLVMPRYAHPISVLSQARIEVTNTRTEAVDTEINYGFVGTVVEDGGSKVKSVAKYDNLNPENLLSWRLHLPPGEKKSLVVRFKTVAI